MNRLEIDGAFESNPFRPDMPEEARDNPTGAFDFLREQAENLRRTHNLNQAGDTTFSWEILTQLEDRPRFTLGSIGRFFHPLYGMIFARYVIFQNINPNIWSGAPYGLNKGIEEFDWSVTNQFDRSFNDFVMGIGASYEVPTDGQYGWIIVNGINIQSLYTSGVPSRFNQFAWYSSGFVVATSDTSGPSIGRIISEPIDIDPEDEGAEIPPAGAYIDCLTLQQTSMLGAQLGSIEELIQQLEITSGQHQQVLYESIQRVETNFTYSDTIVGQALRSITDRLTAIVSDRVTITQEVRDSMQLMVNYYSAARVDAQNTADAASRVHTKLTATNEFARTASISAGEAGFFAESATQMRNEATLARNEAGISAAAAALSEQNASVSETDAGVHAAAALTHSTNAATSASNAAAQAGFAEFSAGEASTSATQASNSATAADGSASVASASATTATNAATTASTQASNASTSASQASTSASNAAGSASSASISATAASQSSNSAQDVANRLLPDRPGIFQDFIGNYAVSPAESQAPLTAYYPAATAVQVGGEGLVFQKTGNCDSALLTRGKLPVGVLRKFKAESRIRVTSNPATDPTNNYSARPALFVYDSADSFLGTINWIWLIQQVVADGWQNHASDVITSETIKAVYSTAAYIRGASENGRRSDGGDSGSTWQMSVLRLRDVTSEVNAAASATSALTAATDAQGYASSASTQALNASVSAGNANTSAIAAAASATSAGTSSASATSSAELAARLSSNQLTTNPKFAIWPSGTMPSHWLGWQGIESFSKGTSIYGANGLIWSSIFSQTSYGLVGFFSENSGQAKSKTGWFMVELDLELTGGNFNGMGVYIQGATTLGAEEQSFAFALPITKTTRNVAPGGSPALGLYSWRFLVNFTDLDVTGGINIFLLRWDALWGNATPTEGKSLIVHSFGIRTASNTEATVSTVASAMIDSNNNAIAAWETTTVAGSASAAIRMRTQTGPGVYDSTIALEAEEFQVFNGTDRAAALKISGGRSLFRGDVQVNGAVLIGTRRIPIALQSFQILAGDGETVDYGTDLVNLPTLLFETDGLAAKTAAQTYDVKALSQTSTGFVMRAKILTVGSGGSVSSGPGTNTGGSPSWQMDKTDAADSYNSNYTFTATLNVTFSGGEPGFYEATGEYECFVRPSGGSWASIGTIQKFFINGTQTTLSKVITGTLSYGDAIGQHGSNTEFGISAVQGVITAFTSVIYTKQGTSGESSATPSGEKVRVTVIPNNT